MGIIGAGSHATKRVYPVLHYLPVTLAAVCDLDRAKAERNARVFGAERVYTDHQQMLAEAELDAVIVVTGQAWHPTLAIDVMNAGLPVYTEKPPAVQAADAYRMLEASRKTGQICMTGFKKRFAPAYRKARAAIESPDFGAPTLLSVDYCCGPNYTNDPTNPRMIFLLDFGVHIIDLTRYLFGDVAEVYARHVDQLTYAVHLVFRNGALGTLALSGNRAWQVSTEKIELTGGPGRFITCTNSVEMAYYVGSKPWGGADIVDWQSPSFSTSVGDSLRETGFVGELEEFVSAVHQHREPESSIASSAETMRLYEAIGQSAAEASVIRLFWPAETRK